MSVVIQIYKRTTTCKCLAPGLNSHDKRGESLLRMIPISNYTHLTIIVKAWTGGGSKKPRQGGASRIRGEIEEDTTG